MSDPDLDLRSLERSTYRTVFDDGLVDLLAGAWVVSLGLGMIYDLEVLPAVLPAMGVAAWLVARRRITEPRIGKVRLHPSRRERLRRAIGWMVGVLAAVALLGAGVLASTGASPGPWLDRLNPLPLGVVLAGVLAVAASALELRRAFVHAGLVLAGFACEWLGVVPRGASVLVAGTVIFLIGGVLFVRFLSDHPLPGDSTHGA